MRCPVSCELTAKGPQVGHKVSHSNIKTKRRFLPNLCQRHLHLDALGRNVRLRVSTNALKSVDHNGGLDAFLQKARATVLSPRALELKRAIEKKVGKPVFVKKGSQEGELRRSRSRNWRIESFEAAGSKDPAVFVFREQ